MNADVRGARAARVVAFAVLVLALLAAHGCSLAKVRRPVPRDLLDAARIPGAPHARMWGDELPDDFDDRLELLAAQTRRAGEGGRSGTYNLLAISGGGPDGAFGAGLLKGWSESGTRPEFRIVTGVSTGALIAPFAFLGPDYDDELERLYTETSTRDLVSKRGPIRAIMSDALTDTTPLRKRIAELVDEQMIEDIAAEYEKGRRLLVGTTNLDARRPVIWNLGAIAALGGPDSQYLIEQVILASASIPGFFPPVHIDVEADGRRFDEMHVDGGTTTQVFLYPVAIDLQSAAGKIGVSGTRRIYVIRNSRIDPPWSPVAARLLPIAKASISTLISTQGVGDLYRLYLQATSHEIDYKLAYIPAEFSAEAEEEFDAGYMIELFSLGYEMARDGYPWMNSPPGLEKGRAP